MCFEEFVLSAELGLGLIALAPSAYAQTYWNGAPNAPPPEPAYAAPGPYGWGYGWAPGYGVNFRLYGSCSATLLEWRPSGDRTRLVTSAAAGPPN